MKLKTVLFGTTYAFGSIKEVLNKAGELRSGDVLAGVAGAKRVGMRAYCVRDAHSEKDFPAMAALADGCVDTLDQMRAYHDFVE